MADAFRFVRVRWPTHWGCRYGFEILVRLVILRLKGSWVLIIRDRGDSIFFGCVWSALCCDRRRGFEPRVLDCHQNVLSWLRICCAPLCDRRRGLEVGMLDGDQVLRARRLVVE